VVNTFTAERETTHRFRLSRRYRLKKNSAAATPCQRLYKQLAGYLYSYQERQNPDHTVCAG